MFDELAKIILHCDQETLLSILSDVCLCLGKYSVENKTFDFWYQLYKVLDEEVNSKYYLEE